MHHSFAAIFSCQQTDQRLRRVLQSADDIFLNFQFSGFDPGLQVGHRLFALVVEIRHDEALHEEALDDDQA
ncbi:MAG: hypothetical protein J0I29_15480, partial [Rhizobiales bacterium]|nr:hypothetical protein [Hyphomicrobiales bacterium]